MKQDYILLIMAILLSQSLNAQEFAPNYDENKVPEYTLPEILENNNGTKITTIEEWETRRNEIIEIFENEVYGIAPLWEGKIKSETISENNHAINGTAIRKEIKLTLEYQEREQQIIILLYLPKTEKPAPVFLGLNFYGNHTITTEPDIQISSSWVINNQSIGIKNHLPNEAQRGALAYRWPLELIISEGYGVATVFCGDIAPDHPEEYKSGVHRLMNSEQTNQSWETIAAWAWGLSRVMDYFETTPFIHSTKVAVIGHSRLGKAAIWAGAIDTRFSMVISNNSGCGGAALSRRQYGETVQRINERFPHWFAQNFKKYNLNERELPIDQHQLLALLAPRPLYVASAEDDQWADPHGEFLSSLEASKAYELYGFEGLPVNEMPRVNTPVYGQIAYHYRTGEHEITYYDWKQYLDFAHKHWGE